MSQDINRLKELLFENESRALADLSQRMDIVFDRAGSTERFTAHVAAVLDQALAQAEIERHSEVSLAIAPLIVHTIKTEIRGSQDELAEALYPSLGRMVKAYVVSAIRDLMDEINRRLESNAFMLRLRSLLTGRPVADLAFVEGQRLKVEEIFLIRRGLGELLGHWPAINGLTAQDKRISGILTAINEVATQAFDADTAALRRIDLGTSIIYLRASPTHLLAAKCRGVAPAAVEQVIDEKFLSTIERLRVLFNGGSDTSVPRRAVNNLLGDLADTLDDGITEQHAKLVRGRTGLSPAIVLVWGIGLALATWLAWGAYVGYQTARVHGIASNVLAAEPALAGYPVHADVTSRGRSVALAGLVPTTEAGQHALSNLRSALPASEVVDRTTALPTRDLDEARADIAVLKTDMARARAEAADANTALSARVAGIETELNGEIKTLAADLAKANADATAGLGGLRTALTQSEAKAEAARQANLGTRARRDRQRDRARPACSSRGVDRRQRHLLHQGHRLPRCQGRRRRPRHTRQAHRGERCAHPRGRLHRREGRRRAQHPAVAGARPEGAGRVVRARHCGLAPGGRRAQEQRRPESIRGRCEPQPSRRVRDRLCGRKYAMTARKIMLLGEIGVGKSSIARRLVFDRFESDYKPTLGVDVYSYEIEPSESVDKGDAAKFIIWDTDGNFGDAILSHIYVKHAAGALIVGDVTRRTTLESMLQLGRSFLNALPGRYCSFLLNKSDLGGTAAELPQALVHSQIPIVRTSAKTGENVKEAFLGAADAIRRRRL